MLTTTPDERGPETAAQQVAADVLAAHRCHLSELSIKSVEGGIIICGQAFSYYGKQIAFHEVRRRSRQAVVANEVQVLPRQE